MPDQLAPGVERCGSPGTPAGKTSERDPRCAVRRTAQWVGTLMTLALLWQPRASWGAEAMASAADYPLACHYFGPELDRFERCARPEGETIRIAPAHARRMPYEHGLAEVRIAGIGCLWARRDGLARPVLTFDNGPDPFVQGLTRGRRGDKIAFYDRRLRLVLATDYDWSFPFNARGQALVCKGCRSDGQEHASMIGGRWGIIDRAGHLVMPLTEGAEPSRRFFGGNR